MSKFLAKLKAERDALNERIANFKPLARSVALKKLHAYVAEHSMNKEELFPVHHDEETDYEVASEPEPDLSEDRFPEFEHGDTFDYTFIADLVAQRDELDWEIEAIRREAIERARAFIREYKLVEKDVFPSIKK